MPASRFYSKVLQHWEMEEWRQEAVSLRRPTPSWVHLAVEWVRMKSGGRRLLACAFVLPPGGRNWAVRECLWLMQWVGVAFSLLFIVLTVEIACAAFHAVVMAVHSVCASGIVSCSPPPVCLPAPALLQYSVRVNVCVCLATAALLQYSVRVNVCV